MNEQQATSGNAGADATTVPRPVAVSFWLWIAAGVIFVVGYVITLVGRQPIIDLLVRTNVDPAVPADRIATGTTVVFGFLVAGSVIFALLYALFGWKAREGARSARTTLTVLVVATLLFQLVQLYGLITLPATLFATLVATLVALVALLLLYLPGVRGHFPADTTKRRPWPGRGRP